MDCPAAGCANYATLTEAETACSAEQTCGGITLGRGHAYQLRAGNAALPSPYQETSWLVGNAADCHPLPRLPNINYKPGVYVRIREQNVSSGLGKPQYFYADNDTLTALDTPEAVTVFYSELAACVALKTSMGSPDSIFHTWLHLPVHPCMHKLFHSTPGVPSRRCACHSTPCVPHATTLLLPSHSHPTAARPPFANLLLFVGGQGRQQP